MPLAVLRLELMTLAQVFRVALGAFPLSCWSLLHAWGGPRITRWAFMGCAALARAALHTFPQFNDIHNRLRHHVAAHPDWCTLEMVGSGRCYPHFWRSE
eukprot:481437-Pyramimonas_sp.AAC.1